MNRARHSPPDTGLTQEGWTRHQEEVVKPPLTERINGADRVVENGTSFKERILKHFGNPDHPVCAAAVAAHLFLDGAATPPVSDLYQEGNCQPDIHSTAS
jgi:hypothetical protein